MHCYSKNITKKNKSHKHPLFFKILFIYLFFSRLRPIDTEFMKQLGAIVSIVPVIAKADTLTIAEREDFKEKVRN